MQMYVLRGGWCPCFWALNYKTGAKKKKSKACFLGQILWMHYRPVLKLSGLSQQWFSFASTSVVCWGGGRRMTYTGFGRKGSSPDVCHSPGTSTFSWDHKRGSETCKAHNEAMTIVWKLKGWEMGTTIQSTESNMHYFCSFHLHQNQQIWNCLPFFPDFSPLSRLPPFVFNIWEWTSGSLN